MIKQTVTSVVAFLYLFIFATCAYAGEGFDYKSTDGRLIVWVPMKPQVSERELPSTTGSPYRQITIASETSQAVFLAGILDFRKGFSTKADEMSYLDSMLSSLKQGFGKNFVLDKNDGSKDLVSSTGQKGRQIKGTVDGQQLIIRAYIGKYSIYMQQATFPITNITSLKNAERFFDSLVITDSVK